MGKYGESAVIAVNALKSGKASNPADAWSQAVREVFPDSKSSRSKGCPRSTFLGMCEEGLVKGVISGQYTKSKKNKAYALNSLSLLVANPDLTTDTKRLWGLVLGGEEKQHNQQMDIVVTLWNNDLIYKDNI